LKGLNRLFKFNLYCYILKIKNILISVNFIIYQTWKIFPQKKKIGRSLPLPLQSPLSIASSIDPDSGAKYLTFANNYYNTISINAYKLQMVVFMKQI